jgi:hypothetical protein
VRNRFAMKFYCTVVYGLMRRVLVIVVLFCALSGCNPKPESEPFDKEAFSINAIRTWLVCISAGDFYVANGYWPLSDDELEIFCSDPNSRCGRVPWNRIEGQYTELPDGRLRVSITSNDLPDPCSLSSFAFTLNIPDPNIAAKIKQQCLSDPNTDIRRVLECALRKEFADSNKPAKSNRNKHDDTYWPVVIPFPQHHH